MRNINCFSENNGNYFENWSQRELYMLEEYSRICSEFGKEEAKNILELQLKGYFPKINQGDYFQESEEYAKKIKALIKVAKTLQVNLKGNYLS